MLMYFSHGRNWRASQIRTMIQATLPKGENGAVTLKIVEALTVIAQELGPGWCC